MHNQKAISAFWGPPRFGGLLSNHPNQNQKDDEFSNEQVHCRKVSATFSRSLKRWEIQGKCKNAIFSGPFSQMRKLMGPTLPTCNVGAWRAELKSLYSLLFSSHRLVHVCWCTLGALTVRLNAAFFLVCRDFGWVFGRLKIGDFFSGCIV